MELEWGKNSEYIDNKGISRKDVEEVIRSAPRIYKNPGPESIYTVIGYTKTGEFSQKPMTVLYEVDNTIIKPRIADVTTEKDMEQFRSEPERTRSNPLNERENREWAHQRDLDREALLKEKDAQAAADKKQQERREQEKAKGSAYWQEKLKIWKEKDAQKEPGKKSSRSLLGEFFDRRGNPPPEAHPEKAFASSSQTIQDWLKRDLQKTEPARSAEPSPAREKAKVRDKEKERELEPGS